MKNRAMIVPVLLILLLVACGGGGGGGDNGGGPSGIGPSGGTASSNDDRASVNIPAGALSQDTAIAVVVASNPPAGNIGTAYDFGPDGTNFNQSVTISITYDDTTLPGGVTESGLTLGAVTNNQWVAVANASVDTTANVVSGTTTHFSVYGVTAVSDSGAVPAAPTGVTVAAGDGQVTVSWDAVSGVTSYNIYMAAQSGVTKSNYSALTGGMAHIGAQNPFVHTGLTNGSTYYFVVTAVNASGESPESTEISAALENRAPVAKAGDDQFVSSRNVVQLDGSASSDSDGDTLTYHWSLLAIPLGSVAALSDPNSVRPSFVADLPGSYVARLIVNDGSVDSAQEHVLIVSDLGTFSSKLLAGGIHTDGTATADFNRDGHLDIASTSYVFNTSTGITVGRIAILLGNGAGTFSAPTFFTSGDKRPNALTTGDFNGDGFVDLAVTNEGFSGESGDTVSILLGNAFGGFSTPTAFFVGENPRAVVVGDFNGDHVLDLAVGKAYASSRGVSILLGDGTGSFSDSTDFEPENASSVSTGDFNGDQIVDLAVAHNGVHTATTLTGDGTGRFSRLSEISISSIGVMDTADLNGDSILDVAATRTTNPVAIFLGRGGGAFRYLADFDTRLPSSALGSPVSIKIADFNGDLFLDLAVGRLDGTIGVLFGDGTGSFSKPFSFSVGGTPDGMAVGDFNGDGFTDIVAATGSGVVVLLWVPR
jgi:hypothetical protein